MGSNVLPFAVRRPVDTVSRGPAVKLIVVSKSARLAILISPRKRG